MPKQAKILQRTSKKEKHIWKLRSYKRLMSNIWHFGQIWVFCMGLFANSPARNWSFWLRLVQPFLPEIHGHGHQKQVEVWFSGETIKRNKNLGLKLHEEYIDILLGASPNLVIKTYLEICKVDASEKIHIWPRIIFFDVSGFFGQPLPEGFHGQLVKCLTF